MRGDFILVVLMMMNRIRSFQTGLITARANGLSERQTFAESISMLTEEQIRTAAENIDNNVAVLLSVSVSSEKRNSISFMYGLCTVTKLRYLR
eukprot:scaffold6747_cov84-Skeletonema_marinoi.AAC.1